MRIVPIVNVVDSSELAKRVELINQLYSKFPQDQKRVQIDVADGSFTNGYANWKNPQEFIELETAKDFFIEIDALLLNPEEELKKWIPAGIKRFIFYLEAAPNPDSIIALAKENSIEPVLAFTPSTTLGEAAAHLEKVSSCQLLAVNPGLSGQEFNPSTLDKIIAIRALFPEMSIEIDGGVNDEVAKLCAISGADTVATSSFLFNSPDPLKTYEELLAIR